MFSDRHQAGFQLGQRLHALGAWERAVVLALPRGGVPVAFEVAEVLHATLDLLLVRKLGLPEQPELAMGAIASGGVRVLNERLVEDLGIPAAVIDEVARTEHMELERRERAYRGDHPPLEVRGRPVIIVDDGLATGSTMRAAAVSLRTRAPAKVVVAVPVGAKVTCKAMRREGHRVVALLEPDDFAAVGAWYEDFSPTGDDEIRTLLARAWGDGPAARTG